MFETISTRILASARSNYKFYLPDSDGNWEPRCVPRVAAKLDWRSPPRRWDRTTSHQPRVGPYMISGKSVTKKKNARFRYFQEPLYTPDSFFLTLLWSLLIMQKTRSRSHSSLSRSIHLKLAIWSGFGGLKEISLKIVDFPFTKINDFQRDFLKPPKTRSGSQL